MHTPGRPVSRPWVAAMKAAALLVAGEHELDRGGAQGLDRVEVLLARHPEDAIHPLALQRRDQKIRTLEPLCHLCLHADRRAVTVYLHSHRIARRKHLFQSFVELFLHMHVR